MVDYFAPHSNGEPQRHLNTFVRKADAFLITVSHDVREGVHVAESSTVTISEAAELWLQRAARGKLERSTRKQYRGHFDHHIKPLLGHVKLSALSTPRVQQFAHQLLGRQVDANHRGNGDGSRPTISRAT
ncbi:MAG: hypothetical protein JNM29_23320, partial [Candidatus Odyssella sp.]|nr:hypothetical protein [Candidatus Odyssella sp.]